MVRWKQTVALAKYSDTIRIFFTEQTNKLYEIKVDKNGRLRKIIKITRRMGW